mmetsp:Transcript_4093/g.8365  ORF Transcript_4093/g.8365 Transcript_4093/m.8365 type:complete len:124 (+) Transcript_4093:409-780(+)
MIHLQTKYPSEIAASDPLAAPHAVLSMQQTKKNAIHTKEDLQLWVPPPLGHSFHLPRHHPHLADLRWMKFSPPRNHCIIVALAVVRAGRCHSGRVTKRARDQFLHRRLGPGLYVKLDNLNQIP